MEDGEIVLVTGSSGFLGTHVLKHLLSDQSVKEIRAIDRVPTTESRRKIYRCSSDNSCDNDVGSHSEEKIQFFQLDLLNVPACREIFKNVDVVLHCAGRLGYDYPPDRRELEECNVEATENVVNLCLEQNVPRLVHCSTTEITLKSYFRGGLIAVVVYLPESRLPVLENESRLIFGTYAATKARAEKLVLQADGNTLKNGKDCLRTVALRPTLLYGDGDSHLIPAILGIARERGNTLPRISGAGGKQQITYVGNAAWAFIKAKNALKSNPEAIAGLPIHVTDDTLIEDITRFCERATRESDDHVKISTWRIPLYVSYVIAFFLELLADFGIFSDLRVHPTSLVSYVGSVILYNRARASIHMNYWPKFNQQESLALASKYYGQLRKKSD